MLGTTSPAQENKKIKNFQFDLQATYKVQNILALPFTKLTKISTSSPKLNLSDYDSPVPFDICINCLFTYYVRFDVNMNPICQTDINNPECQLWMNKVCEHCKELYAKEASDTWAAWWHDDTPPIYKEVDDMTVYDCNKLKNLLEMEVAALKSNTQTISMEISDSFMSWKTVLFFAVYIMVIVILVLICYTCQQARRSKAAPNDNVKKMEVEKASTVQEAEEGKGNSNNLGTSKQETPYISEQKLINMNEKRSKEHITSWMREKARPFLVYNVSEVRSQQTKSMEKENLRDGSTDQKFLKWAKKREKQAEKAKEKKQKAELKKQKGKEKINH